MARAALLAVLGAGLLVTVAACTGSRPTPARDTVSAVAPSSGSPAASASGSASGSAAASSSGAPSGATGPDVPPVPAVPAGSAGAYTLVVPGRDPVTTAVPSVSCAQDGSLTATGLRLAPGGTGLTFVDVEPVGTLAVPGRADITVAGGVFRGATATAATTFAWTC